MGGSAHLLRCQRVTPRRDDRQRAESGLTIDDHLRTVVFGTTRPPEKPPLKRTLYLSSVAMASLLREPNSRSNIGRPVEAPFLALTATRNWSAEC